MQTPILQSTPLAMMIKKITRNLCAALLVFLPLGLAQAQTKVIEPQKLVITAPSQTKMGLPQLPEHQMDLRRPGGFSEPFIPKFVLTRHDLPDEPLQNLGISGLTELSPFLSALFQGGRGAMEQGIVLFEDQDYQKAGEIFYKLFRQDHPLSGLAGVWAAWSAHKLGQDQEGLEYLDKAKKAEERWIKNEAYYLQGLLLLKLKAQARIKAWLDEVEAGLPSEERNFRLSYALVVGQLEAGRPEKALEALQQLRQRPIAHQYLRYKLHELAALVHLNAGDSRLALKEYQQALARAPHPSLLDLDGQILPWLLYLESDYPAAQAEAERLRQTPGKRPQEEWAYLTLACQVRQEKFAGVERILDSLDPKSDYYKYAAFLIHASLKDSTQERRLYDKVAGLDYDFKEMKFYISLLRGNKAFKEGKIKEAQNHFLQALAVDTKSNSYWVAEYNHALTSLSLGQAKAAGDSFLALAKDPQVERPLWVQYHLALVHFQQAAWPELQSLLAGQDFSSLDISAQWEIKLMQAGALVAQGKDGEAIPFYLWGWQKAKKLYGLEQAAKLHYAKGDYPQVLELTKLGNFGASEELIGYEVRSLLALQRFQDAQTRLEALNLPEDRLVDLHVEVWSANQAYERVVARLSRLLTKDPKEEERFAYYLWLGDAHFNLKDFTNAKNQFYKALKLTQDPDRQSSLLYNILLASYYAGEKDAFLREAQATLARPQLKPEVRYNLVVLLVDHLVEEGQAEKGDQVLEDYVASQSFQKAKLHIKRVAMLKQTGRREKCFLVSQREVALEDHFQARDLLLLSAACAESRAQAEEITPRLEAALKDQQDYRRGELGEQLALLYHRQGQYQKSNQAAQDLMAQEKDQGLQNRSRLLIAQNWEKLQKPKEALEALGDPAQYRVTEQYSEALGLRTRLLAQKGDTKEAVKGLLRQYYLEKENSPKKQALLLEATQLQLDAKDTTEAKRSLDLVDSKILEQDQALKQKYLALKARLLLPAQK